MNISNWIKEFKRHSNSSLSVGMRSYMRYQFEFLGIQATLRKQLQSDLIKASATLTEDELISIINCMWMQAEREFQLVAVDLLTKRVDKLSKNKLHFIAKIIQSKPWWDTVDGLSSRVLGPFVLKTEQPDKLDDWIQHENMWIRRAAILHQLKYKSSTNELRLFKYCSLCSYESEFFIQKAIGWALREYSKTNPDEVFKYIQCNIGNLSKLSIREGLKIIANKSL